MTVMHVMSDRNFLRANLLTNFSFNIKASPRSASLRVTDSESSRMWNETIRFGMWEQHIMMYQWLDANQVQVYQLAVLNSMSNNSDRGNIPRAAESLYLYLVISYRIHICFHI